MAFAAWRGLQDVSAQIRTLLLRLDEIERLKGVADSNIWVAKLKVKGSKKLETKELTASNESDAVRQLLVQGIGPDRVVSLEKKG